nr:retrovirus-related Pol polyprotein from transposon TNT 1-94 [Tanacetum cinerariifolium]
MVLEVRQVYADGRVQEMCYGPLLLLEESWFVLYYITLYVDDMLVAGSDMAEIKKLKRQLSQEFEMMMQRLCQPLGEQFKLRKKQAPKTKAFRRIMAKVLYASVVGSVMYAMVCTRPDIAHRVGVVSKYMSNPGSEHLEAVKCLLRYLKGILKATLWLRRKEVVLEGFFDSYYGGCLDLGKSITSYVFTVVGTSVSWMSSIQKCVRVPYVRRYMKVRVVALLKGKWLRVEGSSVDMTKHNGGGTLLTQKLLGTLLLCRAEED